MTRRPSPLAIALLDRFIPNEALKGDLVEQSGERSRAWLWHQVALAIVGHAVTCFRTAPRLTTEAMLVATAMLALIGFNAVVVANLLSQLFLLNDADWILHSGRYAGRQIYATAPLVRRSSAEQPGDWRLPSRASRAGDSRLRFERNDGSLRELLSLCSHCAAAPVHSESRSTDCRCAALCWRLVRWHQLEVDMRTAALVVICAALAAMNGLSAQTPPAFEVASIRRNTSGTQQGGGLAAPQPGGRFIAVGATLETAGVRRVRRPADHRRPCMDRQRSLRHQRARRG